MIESQGNCVKGTIAALHTAIPVQIKTGADHNDSTTSAMERRESITMATAHRAAACNKMMGNSTAGQGPNFQGE